MGEADSKKQREKVKDRFVVVLVAHAVRVTILLCQVSEGLEDSEKGSEYDSRIIRCAAQQRVL